MRFDENTRKLIQIFEDNLGTSFWKNTAILFTHWSSSPSDERRRKQNGLSEAKRKGDVISKLREHFLATHDIAP